MIVENYHPIERNGLAHVVMVGEIRVGLVYLPREDSEMAAIAGLFGPRAMVKTRAVWIIGGRQVNALVGRA